MKHEAVNKFSVRSAGAINLINVPFKNNEGYKSGTAEFNQNSVRFGEQEYFNFNLLPNKNDIADFLQTYASHEHKRRNMIKTLVNKDIENLDSFDSNDEAINLPTNTTETIRALFKGIGIKIEKE